MDQDRLYPSMIRNRQTHSNRFWHLELISQESCCLRPNSMISLYESWRQSRMRPCSVSMSASSRLGVNLRCCLVRFDPSRLPHPRQAAPKLICAQLRLLGIRSLAPAINRESLAVVNKPLALYYRALDQNHRTPSDTKKRLRPIATPPSFVPPTPTTRCL